MTPLDFPDNPVPDEVFSAPRVDFIWKTPPDRWRRQAAAPLGVTLTSLVPDTADVNMRPTVEFNGTGFTVASIINFGSSTLTPTFVSDTQLTARIDANPIPETLQVTVSDGGNTSNALPFIVTPQKPMLIALVPDVSLINTATPVRVEGSYFYPNSVVHFDGVAVPTTYVSATDLDIVAPVNASVATASVTVVTDTKVSNAKTFSYLRAVIFQLVPGIVLSTDPNQTVRILGAGFVSGAVARVTDIDQPTTFISDTELTFVAPLQGYSTTYVKVFQDGYVTNDVNIYLTTLAGIPDITQLIPDQVPINDATTVIRVLGNGFWTDMSGAPTTDHMASVVHFDGVATPTILISMTEIQATAPLKSSPGTVQVTVVTYGTTSVTSLPLDYV